MLFCELDGGLCHLWRLWRCIRGWESYQTARKNEGWKSGKTCRWSSQSLASADTKRNRALRKNKIDIRNRFLGSVGWLRVRLGQSKLKLISAWFWIWRARCHARKFQFTLENPNFPGLRPGFLTVYIVLEGYTVNQRHFQFTFDEFSVCINGFSVYINGFSVYIDGFSVYIWRI